jgi:hypothetical protein
LSNECSDQNESPQLLEDTEWIEGRKLFRGIRWGVGSGSRMRDRPDSTGGRWGGSWHSFRTALISSCRMESGMSRTSVEDIAKIGGYLSDLALLHRASILTYHDLQSSQLSSDLHVASTSIPLVGHVTGQRVHAPPDLRRCPSKSLEIVRHLSGSAFSPIQDKGVALVRSADSPMSPLGTRTTFDWPGSPPSTYWKTHHAEFSVALVQWEGRTGVGYNERNGEGRDGVAIAVASERLPTWFCCRQGALRYSFDEVSESGVSVTPSKAFRCEW